MLIYLYVKQCSHCNLKYFGKTTNNNPKKYRGSGKYWSRHIKSYNSTVKTINIWKFDDIDICNAFALNFSKENNIVESEEWANLILENGIDGFPPGIEFSKKHKNNIKLNHRDVSEEKNPMYGKNHTEKSKRLMRQKRKIYFENGNKGSMYKKHHTEHTKNIISKTSKNRFVNGSKSLEKILITKSTGTWITPWGTFSSANQASKSPKAKYSASHILKLCRNNTQGYSYLPKI